MTNPLSDQPEVNPFSRFGIGFLTSPLSAYGLLWEHLMQVVESLESGPNKSLTRKVMFLLWLILLWAIYVPIHELMHAFGCTVTGGEVQEIRLSVFFGGSLLEQWIPVFKADWSLGGRLSQFSTGGSDWVYLATDIFPYIPSILFGVWLLGMGLRSNRQLVLALGLILALAPILSIPGDYYEMGSIVITDLIKLIWGTPEGSLLANSIDLVRSDDIILLIEELAREKRDVGLLGKGISFLFVAFSFTLGVWLAGVTYWMSDRSASVIQTCIKNGKE